MRVIVIGDIHGCLEELRDLLEHLSPTEQDIVACVGDFVTKGPRPLDCLELWRERGWKAVLGNNDRAVLRALRGENVAPKAGMERDARRLAERPDLARYLDALPLVIDLPRHDTAIVHGGVLPHERFDDGVDPTEVLTLRHVVKTNGRWRSATESDSPESLAFWADVWNGDRFVVYGHTPRPDVARHSRALGIDTGCVYGWSLTAAIRSDGGTWSTISVPARCAWADG